MKSRGALLRHEELMGRICNRVDDLWELQYGSINLRVEKLMQNQITLGNLVSDRFYRNILGAKQ